MNYFSAISVAFCINAMLITNSANAQLFMPKDPHGETPSDAWTFLPNNGQNYDLAGNYRNDVYFSSVGTYPALFLMKANRVGIVIPEIEMNSPSNNTIHRLDLQFVGGHSSQPVPHVYEPTEHRYNFYETFTHQGITGVTGGKRVVYENVYPRIDVHVYSNKWGPKMYIVVRPHGDPNDINILCTGHDSLKLDLDGYLKLYFDTKFLKLSQGLAYQQQGNSIIDLPWVAHYEIASDSLHVRFEFGDFDPELPLVFIIRPMNPNGPLGDGDQPQPPEWCTYLGGSGNDVIRDLTHDDDGNLYYTGQSSSNSGIPVSAGAAQPFPGGGADIILGKVNEYYEMQTLDQSVWSTYYGGSWGDQGASMVYDDVNDRLTLVGEMASPGSDILNFPLAVNPASYSRPYNGFSNGFIAFFDPVSGQRRYLSRLPGQASQGRYIDVDYDAFGNTYVLCSGIISILSSEFVPPPSGAYYQSIPTPVNGDPQYGYDGFVMQFDANANLIWRTFFGGPNNDYAAACAVDRSTNRLTIVGTTMTANTDAEDDCTAAAGDVELPMCGAGGQFLQTGLNSNNTQGILIPTDGFIAQFDLDQRKLVWSTYFGGLGHDGIMDIASSGSGELYVVGHSGSGAYSSITCGPTDAASGFPVCNAGGYFNAVPGGRKFFIAKFGSGNTLQWCTRFGDTNEFSYTDSQLRVSTDENGQPLVFGSTVHVNSSFTQPLVPTILVNAYNRDTHNDAGMDPKADCFVGLFSETTALLYCTYFGGIGNDLAGAVDAFDGRIFIGGSVYAGLNFPTHEPQIPDHDPYLDEVPSASATVPDAFLAQLRYDITIGLAEHPTWGTENLLVYPNPTTGVLSIVIPGDALHTILEVTDGLGRSVHRQNIVGNGRQDLDLSQLAVGSYTVTLRSTKGRAVGRVVKTQ